MQLAGTCQINRNVALYVLCLGVLMIVLDTTIVAVALPSVGLDLHVPESSLTWIVNSYMVCFGGFLLLGGRLGDVYGTRNVFLAGIAAFTVASLACGAAPTLGALVTARAIQGIGGAIVTAVSLALIIDLFPEPAARARAIGVYGFVCAIGGSIGELCGGIIVHLLGWQWVFLVNIPIGLMVYLACYATLPKGGPQLKQRAFLPSSTLAITGGLSCLNYALLNWDKGGRMSWSAVGVLSLGIALAGLFLFREYRASDPLVPRPLLWASNFMAANALAAIWSAGMFGSFVVFALFLQEVLHYAPLQAGLAFIPNTALAGALSATLSERLATRFGIRNSLQLGLFLVGIGLVLLARIPMHANYWTDVLPGLLLWGAGEGIASSPLLLVALREVNSDDSGLASGVVNTSLIMGGTVGVALLATSARLRADTLQVTSPLDTAYAATGGYHTALFIGAGLTLLAALLTKPGLQEHGAGAHSSPRPQ
jgi:EmrB/QacA subfamily drug resistance transporter